MRWPSWRSCSKSAAASATRSASSSFLRLLMKTGIRSSRSLGTVTRFDLSSIPLIIGSEAGAPVRDCQTDPAGLSADSDAGESTARKAKRPLLGRAASEQDLAEMRHGAEVARLELERAADIGEALLVARRADSKASRACATPRRNRARCAAGASAGSRRCRSAARRCRASRLRAPLPRRGGMVHPDLPDALLGLDCLRAGARGEALEQGIEERQAARRQPIAPAGDQAKDVGDARHRHDAVCLQ